jgi:hypothetical protein
MRVPHTWESGIFIVFSKPSSQLPLQNNRACRWSFGREDALGDLYLAFLAVALAYLYDWTWAGFIAEVWSRAKEDWPYLTHDATSRWNDHGRSQEILAMRNVEDLPFGR